MGSAFLGLGGDGNSRDLGGIGVLEIWRLWDWHSQDLDGFSIPGIWDGIGIPGIWLGSEFQGFGCDRHSWDLGGIGIPRIQMGSEFLVSGSDQHSQDLTGIGIPGIWVGSAFLEFVWDQNSWDSGRISIPGIWVSLEFPGFVWLRIPGTCEFCARHSQNLGFVGSVPDPGRGLVPTPASRGTQFQKDPCSQPQIRKEGSQKDPKKILTLHIPRDPFPFPKIPGSARAVPSREIPPSPVFQGSLGIFLQEFQL